MTKKNEKGTISAEKAVLTSLKEEAEVAVWMTFLICSACKVIPAYTCFSGGGQRQEQKGPDAVIKLRLTLEDVYNGHDFVFKYNRKQICPHCRGNGADSDDDYHVCDRCQGTGTVTQK